MTLAGIPSSQVQVSRQHLPVAPRTKTYAAELDFRALLDEEASEVELALV